MKKVKIGSSIFLIIIYWFRLKSIHQCFVQVYKDKKNLIFLLFYSWINLFYHLNLCLNINDFRLKDTYFILIFIIRWIIKIKFLYISLIIKKSLLLLLLNLFQRVRFEYCISVLPALISLIGRATLEVCKYKLNKI